MSNVLKKVLLLMMVFITVIAMNLIFWGVGYGSVIGIIWYVLIPICGALFACIDLRTGYDKTKIEIDKDKDYFSELIRMYSPSVLMLVHDHKSKYPLPLVAGLLQLEKKGKIKIGEKISIKSDEVFLSESEVFLLQRIQDKVIDEDSNKEYMELVFKDAMSKELIYKNNPLNIKHGILKAFGVFALVILLIFVLAHFVPKKEIIIPLIVLFTTIYGIFIIYYKTYNSKSSRYVYYNTEKGIEIANKLNALKKYLKGFPKFEDSKREEIIIWDDYIVYSVMFNQNKKVKNNLSKFFISQANKLKEDAEE